LSETPDDLAASTFLNKALNSRDLSSKVVIDKSGANITPLDTLYVQLWLSEYILCMIEVFTGNTLIILSSRVIAK
jgi:transposase-like protein